MPYKFVSDCFHTCVTAEALRAKIYRKSAISHQRGHFDPKFQVKGFSRPPLGDLGATYDDHLRLIGKRVMDFLLALIELFSLGVTAEELRAIIG